MIRASVTRARAARRERESILQPTTAASSERPPRSHSIRARIVDFLSLVPQ